MPMAAPRPCNYAGCSDLITGKDRYCATHKRAVHAAIDARRGSTAERGYSGAWVRVRRSALSREPLCRFCKERGLVVAANEVDHIDGNSRNNADDNLRPLCKSCHSTRTARDQAFGRKFDTHQSSASGGGAGRKSVDNCK